MQVETNNKDVILIGVDLEKSSLPRFAIIKAGNRIVGIADNDSNKVGKQVDGYVIKEVDSIIEEYKTSVFYLITTQKEHESLNAQLDSYGLLRGVDYEYFIKINGFFNPNEYAFYNRTRKDNGWFYPVRVRLELSSYCNLKCVYCRYHSCYYDKLPSGCNKNLSFDNLKKIVAQIKAIGTVKEIYNVQKGEIFCNPQWFEMLKYIRENLELEIFHFCTNGMFLLPENTDRLLGLRFKRLSITVSLDGLDSDENNRIRVGSDCKRIIKNIKYLIKNANETVTLRIANTQILSEANFSDYQLSGEVRNNDNNYLEDIFIDRVVKYAALATGDKIIDDKICKSEQVEVMNVKRMDEFEGCPLPLEELAVDSEGYVVVCGCEPWGELCRIGNINDMELIKLWNAPIMNKIRECYSSGAEVPLCRKCISNAMSEQGSSVFIRR